MAKSVRRAYLAELFEGSRELDPETSRYLNSVLRLQEGDEVEFFDGQGLLSPAVILEASKRSLKVELLSINAVRPLEPAIHLYCALAKGDRTEWLIEKCSELGATSLHWVIYERSQDHKKDHSKRFERWHKIACEAARQSHNAWVPRLHPPTKFFDALAQVKSNGTTLVLDTNEKTRPLPSLPLDAHQPINLFIGPEGGFTNNERQEFEKRQWASVTLGPTVLRIETAAITGISVIRNHPAISISTSRAHE